MVINGLRMTSVSERLTQLKLPKGIDNFPKEQLWMEASYILKDDPRYFAEALHWLHIQCPYCSVQQTRDEAVQVYFG